jgi:hypothetical protein
LGDSDIPKLLMHMRDKSPLSPAKIERNRWMLFQKENSTEVDPRKFLVEKLKEEDERRKQQKSEEILGKMRKEFDTLEEKILKESGKLGEDLVDQVLGRKFFGDAKQVIVNPAAGMFQWHHNFHHHEQLHYYHHHHHHRHHHYHHHQISQSLVQFT